MKRDIEFFVWSVVKVRISILSVGATTGRPRSYRSPPHIRLSSFLIVGTGVPDCPKSLRSQNALSSVAQKRDLQKPSLVREGGDHGAKRSRSTDE